MTRFGSAVERIDHREPGANLPLLSVSQTRGVIRRSELSNAPHRAKSLDVYKVCRANDVVFNKMSIRSGAMGVAMEDGLVTYHYEVMRPRRGTNTRFIVYLMKSAWFTEELIKRERGIGAGDQANVRTTEVPFSVLRTIDAYIPDPDEQTAIADYLDHETAQIDELITEQQRLIDLLRARRLAVLDEITSEAVGDRVRLKHLFAPSSDSNRPQEEVLSVYRDYGVIPKSSRTDNSNRTPENVERYLLVRPGDLVVNRMKAWQGSLGISSNRGIVSGDYEVARPKTARLRPKFAHYFLRSPKMIAEYSIRSTGIRPSQWRRYWDQMGLIEIPLPSKEEQDAIVKRLEAQTSQIDTLIAEAERFIELSKERRSALITAAVTGQIDVRVA